MEVLQRFAHLQSEFSEEVARQGLDVLFAFAQRRDMKRDDADAVVEVLAELPRLDHALEVAISGGDQTHVHRHIDGPAQRTQFALLQDPQQFGLHQQARISDLVKKEGAAVRRFDDALLVGVCPGEGSLEIPEQLALEQCFREGAAVDGDKRSLPPRAGLVDGARH